MQQKNNIPINCRQCPINEFELSPILKKGKEAARFIAVCHATENVLQPSFPETRATESIICVNKTNMSSVVYKPPYNCPVIQKLRNEGKIPFADFTINFLKY